MYWSNLKNFDKHNRITYGHYKIKKGCKISSYYNSDFYYSLRQFQVFDLDDSPFN